MLRGHLVSIKTQTKQVSNGVVSPGGIRHYSKENSEREVEYSCDEGFSVDGEFGSTRDSPIPSPIFRESKTNKFPYLRARCCFECPHVPGKRRSLFTHTGRRATGEEGMRFFFPWVSSTQIKDLFLIPPPFARSSVQQNNRSHHLQSGMSARRRIL